MSFYKKLIHYCAPALCNIKPGNMFFIKKEDFSEKCFNQWKKACIQYGVMSFVINLSETAIAILVCNVCWIRKILCDAEVQLYLLEKGYACSSLSGFLSTFINRLNADDGFPPEIGIILGYPVADVIEFDKNKGRDYKYCGSWKTYSDIEYTKNCQCRYKKCSFMCVKWYEKGYSLFKIIDEYKRINSY